MGLGDAAVMAFVATTDFARAKAFYAGILQLKLAAEDPFALIFDAHGTMLRVSRVPDIVIAPYTVLGWQVPDIVAVLRDLCGRGVVFERYEGFGQDEEGICTFPGGTRVAWFKDPDGNTLSLTQLSS
jgi:predicted enzyme related to lactoylglutathione lyase